MTRPRVPHLLLATAALTACGGSSATLTAVPEQSRTAAQIYADSLNDLSTERSVHIVGHEVDATGSASGIVVDDTQTAARIALSAQGATIYLVVTPANVYASETQSGPWQIAPEDLTVNARSLTLQNTVRCGRIEHGTLTKGAISTVDGQQVIAIDDDGKAPGASPSVAFVSLSGRHRLVRVVDNGATTPGGAANCGHAGSSGPATQSASFDFADYGAPVTVTPPPSGGV